MKLRDTLNSHERDELRNVMMNEPVFAGDTVSHQSAKALKQRGLIKRNKDGEWVADWEAIRNWNKQRTT